MNQGVTIFNTSLTPGVKINKKAIVKEIVALTPLLSPKNLTLVKIAQIIVNTKSHVKIGLKNNNKVKIAKFGTFQVRFKKSRIGRNPKTKEKKIISERKVILFKPSKELKKIINNKYEPKT